MSLLRNTIAAAIIVSTFICTLVSAQSQPPPQSFTSHWRWPRDGLWNNPAHWGLDPDEPEPPGLERRVPVHGFFEVGAPYRVILGLGQPGPPDAVQPARATVRNGTVTFLAPGEANKFSLSVTPDPLGDEGGYASAHTLIESGSIDGVGLSVSAIAGEREASLEMRLGEYQFIQAGFAGNVEVLVGENAELRTTGVFPSAGPLPPMPNLPGIPTLPPLPDPQPSELSSIISGVGEDPAVVTIADRGAWIAGGRIDLQRRARVDVRRRGRLEAKTLGISSDPLSGTSSEVVVHGDGSSLRIHEKLDVGFTGGEGVLDILDGATAMIGEASVGQIANQVLQSQGEVFVQGEGSRFDVETVLHIGTQGRGTVRLVEGAASQTGSVALGQFGPTPELGIVERSRGTLELEGHDTQLVTSLMQVGVRGDGFVNILGGAEVRADAVGLGIEDPGQGFLTVSRPGSRLRVLTQLAIGGEGLALATVQHGAEVSAAGVQVGGPQSASLVVEGEDSLVEATEEQIQIGLREGLGDVVLRSGGTLKAERIFVHRHGTLAGTGRVQGRLVIDGTVDIGLSPGHVVVEGDYEQTADGELLIQIAGLEDGEFDVLEVQGEAALGGHLTVELLDGATLSPGQQVPFLVADSMEGQFTTFDPPRIRGNLELDLVYGESGASLHVVPEPLTLGLLLPGMLLAVSRRGPRRHR